MTLRPIAALLVPAVAVTTCARHHLGEAYREIPFHASSLTSACNIRGQFTGTMRLSADNAEVVVTQGSVDGGKVAGGGEWPQDLSLWIAVTIGGRWSVVDSTGPIRLAPLLRAPAAGSDLRELMRLPRVRLHTTAPGDATPRWLKFKFEWTSSLRGQTAWCYAHSDSF